MEGNTIIIACSIFKNELDHLISEGKVNVPVVYVNSMLHMYPEKLKVVLDKKLNHYKNLRVILAFGDCHARMVDYEVNKNVTRTPGINCCEIFLGSDHYRKIRKEGAFILLPEWAVRWEEVFKEYMGFKESKQIKPFMSEMHKKLVYVNTGYTPTNNHLLNEIADFVGLPLEIYNSSITELEKTILSLIASNLPISNGSDER